ncbi:histidine kinase [Nostoc sp. CMAA1605]|nr:histidine kinase [Nostoc sp. CMAA1605]
MGIGDWGLSRQSRFLFPFPMPNSPCPIPHAPYQIPILKL